MAFVLFAPAGGRCSADLYARRLAEAVGAALVPVAGRTPVPDAEAYASAQGAWEGLAPDARPLIAGTVLPAFAPLATQLARRRAAFLIHEPLAAAPGQSDAERVILAAIEQEMLASGSAIVASCEAAAALIAQQAAVPRARIAIIEPPTPELPRAPGSAADPTLILSSGTRGASQEYELLFAALAGLGDLEWRLCVAGRVAANAEEARAIAALAARFSIAGRVQFQPAGDAVQSEALWQQSDLFACTVARCGYRLATASAIKRGLPVAVAADPASAPRIPPEAGATVAPGDRAQLTKALRRLIFDRDLRVAMAEAAWQAGKALPDERAVGERLRSALR